MIDANGDLIRRIEAVRNEMDSLLESIKRPVSSPRYDSSTMVFRKEIGRSFLDHNRDAFRNALERIGELPSRSSKTLSDLSSMYDGIIECYENNDLDGALSRMDELRELISTIADTIIGKELAEALIEVIDNTKGQMAMTETLRFQIGRPMLRRSCESAFGEAETETIEMSLLPLSNAIRLKIMAMLYTSPRGFTEMLRELEMQKGHLQFHLRKLMDVGYISVDRRTHLYSIEPSGYIMVEGLRRLFEQMERD